MRILVFATDLMPVPGVPTSGTALRTWGIAEGLKASGHDVTISVPQAALQGFYRGAFAKNESVLAEIKKFERWAFNSSNQYQVLKELRPEVIICGHWPAMSLHLSPSQLLILDLAGPHLLERHFQKSGHHFAATLGKLTALSAADYFIVSGEAQYLYFLSFLHRARVSNAEERVIKIAMALPPTKPKQFSPDANGPRFVFGGVFLPWQDPSGGLKCLVGQLEKRKRGSLLLIGGKHPNYDVSTGNYQALWDELSQSPYVTTKPMLPYEEFVAELRNSQVAMDLMAWNIERELAVTIRTTTYLSAGIPVIYNNYAELTQTISHYDAGWTVSGEEECLEAIDEAFRNPEVIARKSENASRLARDNFSWDKAVVPLNRILGVKCRKDVVDLNFDAPHQANLKLSANRTVSQRFVSRVAGLKVIECRVATHARRINQGIMMRAYEREPSKDWLLFAERNVSAHEVENNGWLSLNFKPRAESLGREYLFELEGTGDSDFNCVYPWTINSAPYPLVELSYNRAICPEVGLCIRSVGSMR